MLTRFVRDGAVYAIAGLLGRGISVLLVPLYARTLPPSELGSLDMLLMLVTLANLSVALEVSQAVARFHADAATPGARRLYASTALWFTVAAFAVFWVAGALLVPQLGELLIGSRERPSLIHLTLVVAVANGLFYLAQNQLRWELQPRRYAVASLAVAATTASVSFPLLLWLRLGLLGIVVAQLAGVLVGAVLAFAFARGSYRLAFDGAKCREMLAFSVPLVPASLAVFVAMYVDRIAIRQMLTMADVGVFGVAFRVCAVASLLMTGVQGALMPLVYAHHREAGTPAELARIFRLFCGTALVACVGLAAFGPELLTIVATPAYADAANVIPLLAPAVLLASMPVFAPGLALAKRTRTIAGLTIAGAAINTALNYLLVPRLGTPGAALATLLGAASVFTGYVLASQRLYPVPHRWGSLAAAAAAATLAGAVVVALPDGTPLGIAAKLVLLAGVAAVLVPVGVIRWTEVRHAGGIARARLSSLLRHYPAAAPAAPTGGSE